VTTHSGQDDWARTSVRKISANSVEEVVEEIFGFDEKALREAIEEHMLEFGDKWEYYLSDYINDYINLNDEESYTVSSVELIEIVPGSYRELVSHYDEVEKKLDSILEEHRDQYTEILERAELKRLKEKYD
jgi:hypothetical protein